jgi:DNA polymerase-3 subunit delta
MKLRPQQLAQHLQQTLAPVYLLHGDEPLLIGEAVDAIRHAARERGYDEREVLDVDGGFDWDRLLMTANSGSLFASRRLLELRLGQHKPGDAGGKALQNYAKDPPPDIVLLIIAGKFESSSQRSRWYTALDQAGVTVQAWPVAGNQLPAWIEARMRRAGLRATPEAIALLAERVEGNLLAAAQEIDKLALLFGPSRLSAAQLREAISDSARYSIYDLADAALAGDIERSVRILDGIHREAIEPILVLWALQREIRLLLQLHFDTARGAPLAQAFNRHKVWEKRKPLLNRALQRLSSDTTTLHRLLQDCARLDRIIKGIEPGEPWDELLGLVMKLSGSYPIG